jgi:hypothetical protein
MKVNITVVATKTLTAGFVPSGEVAMLLNYDGTAIKANPLKIAQERQREAFPLLSVASHFRTRPM